MHERRARHGGRRALPRAQPASARAAWPTSTAPRTTQLGRAVALKLLYRRFAEDQEFVERFRREASSAAGLQHPNIVGVFDRGEWDGTYYIAMEFLEGRTLKQLVRERRRRSTPERGDRHRRSRSSARARFAHQRGIVHRDIKPHNVIVDDEGRAKVTDFGIARAGASDMTETGSIMGTAQYLSPEQAQGQPVDAALGPLLDRRRALRAADRPRAVRRRVAGDDRAQAGVRGAGPAARSSTRPSPPALEDVVLRALEKDPARRFADADEFIAALEQARGPGATGAYTRIVPPSTDAGLPGRGRSRRPTGATSRWLAVAAARAGADRGAGVGAYLLLEPEAR